MNNHLLIAKSIAGANEALIDISMPLNAEITQAGKLNALIAIAEQLERANVLKVLEIKASPDFRLRPDDISILLEEDA